MNGYTIAWAAWLALFAVIEGRALMNRQPGDTFSEHVWRWFAVKGGGPLAGVRRGLLVASLAWLSAHFISGGRI